MSRNSYVRIEDSGFGPSFFLNERAGGNKFPVKSIVVVMGFVAMVFFVSNSPTIGDRTKQVGLALYFAFFPALSVPAQADCMGP